MTRHKNRSTHHLSGKCPKSSSTWYCLSAKREKENWIEKEIDTIHWTFLSQNSNGLMKHTLSTVTTTPTSITRPTWSCEDDLAKTSWLQWFHCVCLEQHLSLRFQWANILRWVLHKYSKLKEYPNNGYYMIDLFLQSGDVWVPCFLCEYAIPQ